MKRKPVQLFSVKKERRNVSRGLLPAAGMISMVLSLLSCQNNHRLKGEIAVNPNTQQIDTQEIKRLPGEVQADPVTNCTPTNDATMHLRGDYPVDQVNVE